MNQEKKITKRLITGLSLSALLLAATVSVAGAAGNDNFGGQSQVWMNDYGHHYVNMNNPGNRKDWDNHRFAVPGQGGIHANENSAVMAWGDGTLVDPHGTME